MPMFCSTVSVALDLHDQRVDDMLHGLQEALDEFDDGQKQS
jgi:hypothetical protein